MTQHQTNKAPKTLSAAEIYKRRKEQAQASQSATNARAVQHLPPGAVIRRRVPAATYDD